MKSQINSEVTQAAEMFSKLPVEVQDEILSLMRLLVAQNKNQKVEDTKMETKWFVMYNPVKGYIAARKKNVSSITSDSLEFSGKYSDDKAIVQKLVDILNEESEEK